MASTIFKGIVHGKKIELDREPGLPDGEAVTVKLETAPAGVKLPPGEGIRRAAGAWADEAEEVDKFLEWTRQQRKLDRPGIEE